MKMVEGMNVCFIVLYTLLSISGTIFSEQDDVVYIHCTQTERNKLDPTPKTIIPISTNATTIPQSVTESAPLKIDLCPDHRFLKISWILNQTQESVVKLCYRMDSMEHEEIMDTTCFLLNVSESLYQSSMDCWFPMNYIDRGPTVTAWVHPLTPKILEIFSGSLNTSVLDPGNTCNDVCEVVAMDISSQINCHDSASIFYDTTTVVKRLSFDAIDNTACDNNVLRISKQTEGRLEYQLKCGFNGIGHVKVLYITHGKYCLKYQLVKVHCSNGSYTSVPMTTEDDHTHSFGTFLLFGFVCIIVIGLAFFGIIFAVQWLLNVRAKYLKSHRDSSSDSRNISISVEDDIPLNMNNFQLTERIPQCSTQITVNSTISRNSSKRRFSSSSLSKVPEIVQEKQCLVTSKMRKSVTMALLEDTNPFYKKKILFLPTPFDHFTNEVAKILKTIFSNEAGVFSQCCYDRTVYKHYMTCDRIKWIDTVLGDHDKILIFLCFKSLCTEMTDGKNKSMVEEVLDRLLLSKVESPRLCKVIFLYLTDSSDNVQRKHYGDVFHINNPELFSKFVCDVMNFCGRSVDEYPHVIERVLNCTSSRHFLRYTGIKRASKKRHPDDIHEQETTLSDNDN